jgi:phage terminase large subunit-like protein
MSDLIQPVYRQSLAHELLLRLGPRGLCSALTPEEQVALLYSRAAWERPSERIGTPLGELVQGLDDAVEPGWGIWTGQQEPPGDWLYWLLCAGRSFGKSWRMSHFIMDRALRFPGCWIALVGCTVTSLWSDCVYGKSGLMTLAPPWFFPEEHITRTPWLKWPNGSITRLFSAEEPKRLKGPNNDFAAVEELCAQPLHEAVWEELQYTMRSGELPQTCVATTPDPPVSTLLDLLQSPSAAVTFGDTRENRGNVSEAWLRQHVDRNAGTHKGRQQIGGRIVLEVPGAPFKREWFRREKWCPGSFKASKYRRIGVSIDPARSHGKKSDAWGICKAAMREDGLLEIMADATVNDTPDVAIERAIALHDEEPRASFMVADKGAGGKMIDGLVRLAGGKGIRVICKQSNKGKDAYAAEAAVVFAKHLAFLAPGLHDLENECCTWTPKSKRSPNRMDAMDYLVVELVASAPSQAGLNSEPTAPRRI